MCCVTYVHVRVSVSSEVNNLSESLAPNECMNELKLREARFQKASASIFLYGAVEGASREILKAWH